MTELRTIDPASTALLIMDVQPSIVAQLPDPETFIGGLIRAPEAARIAVLTVGYVRVALTAEDVAAVPTGKVFPRQAEVVSIDDFGSALT